MVGGDVGNGVGCGRGGIDSDGAHGGAVHEGVDPEVEVGGGAGDGGAEVVVGVPYLDDGGVVAVDLNLRWGVGGLLGGRAGGRILRHGFRGAGGGGLAWLSRGRGLVVGAALGGQQDGELIAGDANGCAG